MAEKKVDKRALEAAKKEKEERERLMARVLARVAPQLGISPGKFLRGVEAEAAKAVAAEKARGVAGQPEFVTREYRYFKEEIEREKKLNQFEWLAQTLGKIAPIEPFSEESREGLETALRFTGLKVKPTDIVSFAVLGPLLLLPLAFLVLLTEIAGIFKILALVFPLIVGYMIYTYPNSYANVLRIRAGRDLVIGVLYMIVYMKSSPNLEGAVRFAATSVGGKLAMDLKRILWQVEVGTYTTVEESLMEYVLQWKAYNKEFVESLHLIRESMVERSQDRRDALLDKAIDVVLIGTDERMKKYARDLETPVMVLHGLGVLLPVMGMIVFPLVSIFLAESIANLPLYLFLGYNLILPLIVWFFIRTTFEKRPGTHTAVDITSHPDYSPPGTLLIKLGPKNRIFVPMWPIGAAVGFLVALPGLLGIGATRFFYAIPENLKTSSTPLILSVDVIFGMMVGLVVYYWGTSFQKTAIREKIIEIESEFEEALFALGNRLSGGVPVEKALVEAEEDTKELSISEMFRISLKNINQLGMTFSQSLFDEQYGALRYYPSSLIRTIMKSLAETVEKGTRAAATVMLTISRYLRDIHTTQERIDDILSSTISNMKFQAYILVPVISGVVVAVADLIMKMLAQLSTTFGTLTQGISSVGAGGGGIPLGETPNPAEMFFGLKASVPSEILQLVVGGYVIEILILLGIFVTKIEVGEDVIKQNDTIWKMLITGTLAYIISLLVVKSLFGPLIATASKLG